LSSIIDVVRRERAQAYPEALHFVSEHIAMIEYCSYKSVSF